MGPSGDLAPGPIPVDVIIVVRNAVETLDGALASIDDAFRVVGPPSESRLRELRCEPRILVIDGDSTDGTRMVAVAQPGVRLEAQHGLGLGAARNQGLASTDAPFVAFLDADDLWTPGSLVERVRHLLDQPGADAVVGRLEVFSRTGELPARFARQMGHRIEGLTPSAMVCRRAVFERVGGFSTSLAIGCDTDWFSRAFDAGVRIDELDEVVLHKGIGVENLSHATGQYRQELLTIVRDHLRRTRV